MKVYLQFITNTGDNASNVGTFNYELIDLLCDAGRYDLDADTATIRCLSHIIHLAVTELLVVLKAVKKTDVREDDIDIGDLTEEMAEEIGAEDGGGDGDDNELVGHEGADFDGSIFAKASINHMTHELQADGHARYDLLSSSFARRHSVWRYSISASKLRTRRPNRVVCPDPSL